MNLPEFLNQCPPPWIAFPAIEPDTLPAHMRQGAAEPWFDQQWRPFWMSLTPAQQERYLSHWKASQEWRDALAFFFNPDWEADAAQDAAESEQLLQASRTARAAAKPSLLSRWFRRKR